MNVHMLSAGWGTGNGGSYPLPDIMYDMNRALFDKREAHEMVRATTSFTVCFVCPSTSFSNTQQGFGSTSTVDLPIILPVYTVQGVAGHLHQYLGTSCICLAGACFHHLLCIAVFFGLLAFSYYNS